MEMNLVTVYDIRNKFIAYSAPIPEVIDVLSEWGSLYVLAGDRRVSVSFFAGRLDKKPWKKKVPKANSLNAEEIAQEDHLTLPHQFSFLFQLYHLMEKDTQTKLEILFKKNLYVLAIR